MTSEQLVKMNAKQKEILQVQRSLLSRNIVWTPTLAANLKANNLLTDAMIAVSYTHLTLPTMAVV